MLSVWCDNWTACTCAVPQLSHLVVFNLLLRMSIHLMQTRGITANRYCTNPTVLTGCKDGFITTTVTDMQLTFGRTLDTDVLRSYCLSNQKQPARQSRKEVRNKCGEPLTSSICKGTGPAWNALNIRYRTGYNISFVTCVKTKVGCLTLNLGLGLYAQTSGIWESGQQSDWRKTSMNGPSNRRGLSYNCGIPGRILYHHLIHKLSAVSIQPAS